MCALFIRTCILAICLSDLAFGCSYFPPVYKVSHSFLVHVQSQVGPVVGLKLKVELFKYDEFEKLSEEEQRAADLSRFHVVVAEATTDTEGTATINVKRSETFTLVPDTPAAGLSWVYVEVSDRPTSPTLELQWPPTPILKTRNMRGRLTKGLYSSRSVPLRNTTLKLNSFIDYREIGTTITTEDGGFEFPNAAPGLYFLQIVASSAKTEDLYKPEGNIAIYLALENHLESLAVSTANTSCGLSYDLEENKSRYKAELCFKGGKQVKCEY